MICKKCGKEIKNNYEYCSKCKNDILTEINQKIIETPDNVQLYFERAKFYCELHNFENAIWDYKKILEIEPDNIEAFYHCNRLEDGSYEDIQDFVEKIIEKDPHNAIAFAYRGYCNSQLGYRENAVKDFEKALELETNNEKIHRLIEDCNDPGTRAWVYRNFVENNPDNISGYKREIYALYDCCITNNSFLDCRERYCRERLYYSNNIDFGEDTAEINKLKEDCYKFLNQKNDIEEPEFCEVTIDSREELKGDLKKKLFKLVLNSREQPDWKQKSKKELRETFYKMALASYDTYMKTHTMFENDEIELYFKRGLCHYKMENYTKALQDFNKFIKLSDGEECAKGYLYIGLVYLDKKEYKKAYADFEKAEQYLENGLKNSDDTVSDIALEIDMAKNFANILMGN